MKIYEAVGKVSGKVYVRGTKAEVFRKLNELYPSYKNNGISGRESTVKKVLPETVKVVRGE